MKKNILAFVLGLSVFTGCVFAQNAVITELNGKVEVFRNDSWQQLNAGDIVFQGEELTTGFQSDAKIEYDGTYMTVAQLSRLSFDELSETNTTKTVGIYLISGALRSKVLHNENIKIDYNVTTPVASVTVHGTDFLVLADGTVRCYQGSVEVYPVRRLSNKQVIEEETAENDAMYEEDELPGEYAPAGMTVEEAVKNRKIPGGTVIVKKHQETSFAENGNPEKVLDNALETINSAGTAVQSAGAAEAIPVGGSTTVAGGTGRTADVTGFAVNLVLDD